MELSTDGITYTQGLRRYGLEVDTQVLFNLCSNDRMYDIVNNTKTNNIQEDLSSKVLELREKLQYHLKKTIAGHTSINSTTCDPTYVF